MKVMKSRGLQIAATLIVGLFLGWLFFSGSGSAEEAQPKHDHKGSAGKEQTWTCSMHPQIKQPEPGNCPICGMELIPLEESSGSENPNVMEMTETAVKIAGVQISKIERRKPVKEIMLDGKVKPDERRVFSQIAHIPGRIEKLYVNFTGEKVNKGEKLASVYSEELVTTQKELFEAVRLKESVPGLYESAREKLKQWKLTDKQIDAIESSGKVQRELDILADVSGYVFKRNAALGDRVNTGTVLFQIADLSKVWIMFDLYEKDLQWIDEGDRITFEPASMPGEEFKARITYIDPFINPRTRVAQARAEFNNRGNMLKPETFVTGWLEAQLPVKDEVLTVPESAVLWTGKRSVVYLSDPDAEIPSFEMRVVELGQSLGDAYIVKDGLQAGDVVVTQGAFNVDAAAQLNNKMSMMNRDVGIKGKDKKEQAKLPSFKESTPVKFKKQLKDVINAYLDLTSALVNSDKEKAAEHSKNLLSSLKQVDMKALDDNAHKYWMKMHEIIKTETKSITGSKNIDGQRKSFIALSDAMIKTAKVFGADMKLFVQFCPMANDDKGAYWLSVKEEILNPYYGDMMLHCGEVKEKVGM